MCTDTTWEPSLIVGATEGTDNKHLHPSIYSPIRKDVQYLAEDKICSLTIDGEIKLPRGFASNVAGHAGILGFVVQFSHVDL